VTGVREHADRTVTEIMVPPAERWSPVQSIEKILLSVVSMLVGQDMSMLGCILAGQDVC